MVHNRSAATNSTSSSSTSSYSPEKERKVINGIEIGAHPVPGLRRNDGRWAELSDDEEQGEFLAQAELVEDSDKRIRSLELKLEQLRTSEVISDVEIVEEEDEVDKATYQRGIFYCSALFMIAIAAGTVIFWQLSQNSDTVSPVIPTVENESVNEDNMVTDIHCGSGLVLYNETCIPATITCGLNEIGANNVCTPCKAGQVANEDRQSCSYCRNGYVRSSADGSANGGCVAAIDFCDEFQIGRYGQCKSCAPGEIADEERMHCWFCPHGQVRSPGPSGPCASVEEACQANQIAAEGVCKDCIAGRVADAEHKECVLCPDGTVRGNANGDGIGRCVSAASICKVYQQAFNGMCYNCNRGMVSNGDHTACEFCPDGMVRTNADGTGKGGCVPAESVCDFPDNARQGRCFDSGR